MQIFGALPARKAHTLGTHRTRSPAETVASLRPLMPRFGITRLANITGLDCIGLPVFTAIRPNARSLSTSQGKGVDADAARASALMESIEAWHAEHIEHPLRHDAYRSLAAHARVADIARLPAGAGAAIDLDRPMLWIEGQDLFADAPVWVPFECVSLNMVAPARVAAAPTFFASGNGLASGNHLVEAIVHALCEVIERDAVTLHLLDPASAARRRIDPATVDDPCCRAALERIERAGVVAGLWDVTSDTGVPACVAVVLDAEARPRWRTLGPAAGHGCHPSPAIALFRAISEAVQSRATLIAGSRDDLLPDDYTTRAHPDDDARRRRELREPAPVDFRRLPSLSTDTLDGDLRALLGALRGAGVESAIAVDLTRPEIGIPVVKVVVPGLEPPIHKTDWQPVRTGARARRRGA